MTIPKQSQCHYKAGTSTPALCRVKNRLYWNLMQSIQHYQEGYGGNK